MTDYTELKRLAENALKGSENWLEAGMLTQLFVASCTPSAVLALIAKNDALRAAYMSSEERANLLRAELAGLRTGFEAQNEVIAGLHAQIDAFRRSVAWAIRIHKDPELSHEIPNIEWLDDLDTAMGKGGNDGA